MDPLGMALMAYHAGDHDAVFTITRDDGFEQTVPVKAFFYSAQFPELERRALELSRGTVLDVGAAAGRHSLELARHRLQVWSLDTLPEAQKIMQERGVSRPIVGDILSWAERSFDTVLMLMNGIGMVGTSQRLDEFLRHAHQLVSSGGQILCDSTDVNMTDVPIHVAYRNKNIERGLPAGQQSLTIRYKDAVSKPFEWLHLDFASLAGHCEAAGWSCELILQEPDGSYLSKIVQSPSSNITSST